MSTIQLTSGKVNQMSEMFSRMSSSFDSFMSTGSSLMKKIYSFECGILNIDDVQQTLQNLIDKQEDEKLSVDSLIAENDDFIDTVILRDDNAADAVNERKNDFYEKYQYLKPDSEKTWWEKAWDGVKGFAQWCSDTWHAILEDGFFNVIGRWIHSPEFRSFVEMVVGAFYDIGGVFAIKLFTTLGTLAAVFVKKHPYLSWFIPGIHLVAGFTELFFSVGLSADLDDNGVYHVRPDAWQQYVHYSTGYDDVFRSAVNKASHGNITVDVNQSKIFWVDLDQDGKKEKGEEFILWSWKGDYMNLGAGAETGLYQVMDGDRFDSDGSYVMDENGEYTFLYAEINRDYEVSMTLDLYYDYNNDGNFSSGDRLYSYRPTEKQWWITGFDPLVQNVRADRMRAVTTVDFSSYGPEQGRLFYEAFKRDNGTSDDKWIYDDASMTVTLDWRN